MKCTLYATASRTASGTATARLGGARGCQQLDRTHYFRSQRHSLQRIRSRWGGPLLRRLWGQRPAFILTNCQLLVGRLAERLVDGAMPPQATLGNWATTRNPEMQGIGWPAPDRARCQSSRSGCHHRLPDRSHTRSHRSRDRAARWCPSSNAKWRGPPRIGRRSNASAVDSGAELHQSLR